MSGLEQMREGWDRFAHAYDRAITPITMRSAEEALDLAGVGAGMRVLDVAAGGGALSIPAARRGAEVLAVDYAPAMVELLQDRARELSLSNLTVQLMDGTALELDDDTFDIACSQFGIMLFPDRSAGLRELARVTRPGGKGVMIAFGAPERVQLITLFFIAMRAVGREVSPESSPLFCYQDPAVLRNEMEGTGFDRVQVETLNHWFDVESADVFWETIINSAPAIAGMLADLTDQQREAVRAELGELLEKEYGSGPARLPIDFHAGIGIKRAHS